MRSAALLLLCFGIAQCALDNAGTEFALGFMDNKITNNENHDLELFVTTLSNNVVQSEPIGRKVRRAALKWTMKIKDQTAEIVESDLGSSLLKMVNITTPLYDSSWIQQVNATRGNIVQVNVPAALRGSGVAIESKGILVQAAEEVTVYCVNKQKYSTDAFIAYPVDALGVNYVAVTWTDKPSLMITGITDGTNVNLTFPSTYSSSFYYSGITYQAGMTLELTLHRMETFHLYSETGDLTGTQITSSSAVAAFSGNYKIGVTDTNTGTSSDHLVEQLVATQSWGTEFITFPTPERTVGDYIRVVAAEDNTNFTFDGSTYSLSAYQYTTFNKASGSYYYITANKGICVAIFCKTEGLSWTNDAQNGGDPAMSFSVPVALFGSDYTWSTVTDTNGDFNNYIVIVSNVQYTSDLVLDDASLNTTWVNVTGTTDYVGVYVNVTPGAHSLYNSVPANGFLGMAMGNAQFNSYAYASGLRLAHINEPCNISSTVAGDGFDNDCDGRIDEETDDGIDNDGDGLIDEDLAMYPRVNGNYSEWSSWGACSTTCGGGSGTFVRTRTCDNPPPQNNGLDCQGDASETAACTGPSTPCPIDGNWGDWSSWSTCSVTCGSGVLSRNRSCDNPPPQYNGTDCVGNATDTTGCTVSDYCLPSYFGNILLNCTSTQFGCSTGSMICIDLSFRCDGTRDCDDGTDESVYFAGCSASECRSGAEIIRVGCMFVMLLQLVALLMAK